MDLIITARNIHTLTPAPAGTNAISALGITGGRIERVGTRAQAELWQAASRADYLDATITPGLVDAHVHPIWGQQIARGTYLGKVTGSKHAAEFLSQQVGEVAPGEWIFAWGLEQSAFGADTPSGADFTETFPHNPVFVMLFDGHAALANAKALEQAHIEGAEPLAGAGQIIVDEAGKPTGFLREASAINRLKEAAPPLTFEQKVKNTLATLRAMAKNGLTGGEMLDFDDPQSLQVLAQIEAEGELPLRLRVAPWVLSGHPKGRVQQIIDMQGIGGRRYCVRGAKMMIDGTIDNGSGWLAEPDAMGEGTHSAYANTDEYLECLRAFDAAGVPTSTHAIGDRGIEFVIEAIASIGHTSVYHRIEHIEEITDRAVDALASTRVSASMQPTHCTHFLDPDGADAWSRRLGRERAKRAFRLRDVFEAAQHLALGSDWPIANFDPREIMADAISRRHTKDPASRPITPEQALTNRQALQCYTRGVAGSNGSTGGRIAVGELADLTIFAADPLQLSPEELADVEIVATYVGGQRIAGATV